MHTQWSLISFELVELFSYVRLAAVEAATDPIFAYILYIMYVASDQSFVFAFIRTMYWRPHPINDLWLRSNRYGGTSGECQEHVALKSFFIISEFVDTKHAIAVLSWNHHQRLAPLHCDYLSDFRILFSVDHTRCRNASSKHAFESSNLEHLNAIAYTFTAPQMIGFGNRHRALIAKWSH